MLLLLGPISLKYTFQSVSALVRSRLIKRDLLTSQKKHHMQILCMSSLIMFVDNAGGWVEVSVVDGRWDSGSLPDLSSIQSWHIVVSGFSQWWWSTRYYDSNTEFKYVCILLTPAHRVGEMTKTSSRAPEHFYNMTRRSNRGGAEAAESSRVLPGTRGRKSGQPPRASLIPPHPLQKLLQAFLP